MKQQLITEIDEMLILRKLSGTPHFPTIIMDDDGK